uniref:C-type lectin domain-containing protein n=1 Tax=Stomoxys calcitrans TaxID=35570 RepID=A0A1I8PE21_STOCA
MQCDARAVNVSNTWTMPQEGLNVFYRFFRDRISWFEADAVCQFHHANLVTVDNSFQFDATRDLLRELDVNDIVWIGLMRPQSSDRFMWSSNSRPLVADTGYWAESLPLMDAPLCAVIDPIRDYRWHALRCGGPETASFLCEMPVPTWADICILKDMPNLTMQYMADTASIELIRNCQEEGLLRTTCRGKQDRDRAMQDLICPRERLEAQRINDITNSHFKSLQIINSIPSDNNENNDIELLPMDVNYGSHYPEELQTEKNTVQRLIEQFNVDELMQADEAANMETVSSFYKIPGLIPKPVKKSAKKVVEYPKKDNGGKKQTTGATPKKDKNRMRLEMDDMMLGDQPQGEPEMPEQILNEEVSNEIMEPLPHIKKTNIHKEAMEKMEKEAIAMKEIMQKNKEREAKKLMATTTTTTSTTEATSTTTEEPRTSAPTSSSATAEVIVSTSTVKDLDATTQQQEHHQPSHLAEESTTDLELTHGASSTIPPATIGHPMHPQQPRSSVITEETAHAHVKESADNSHFIPPMLMVKSHYVPQANKHGHNEHSQHGLTHGEHLDYSPSSTSSPSHGNEDATIKGHSEVTLLLTPTTATTTTAAAPSAKVIDFEPTALQARGQLSQKIASELITEEETTENANMIPITTQRQQQHKQEKDQDEDANVNPQIMNAEEETAKTQPESKLVSSTTTYATMEPAAATAMPLSSSSQSSPEQTTPKPVEEQATRYAVGDAFAAMDLNTAKSLKSKPHLNMASVETKPTTKQDEVTTTSPLIPKTAHSTWATSGAENTADQQHEMVTATTPNALVADEQIKSLDKGSIELLTKTPTTDVDKDQLYFESKRDQGELSPKIQETTTTIVIEHGNTDTTATGIGQQLATDIQTLAASGEMKSANEQHKTVAIVATEEATESIPETQPAPAEAKDVIMENEKAAHSSLEPTSSTTTTTDAPIIVTTTAKPTTETNENTTHGSTTPTTEGSTTTSSSTLTSSASSPSEAVASSSSALPSSSTTTTPSTSSPPPPPPTTTSSPSSSSSSSSFEPETTRNFLKVTTEMPFKPNRRRSLTKPDTVSYMKKILG